MLQWNRSQSIVVAWFFYSIQTFLSRKKKHQKTQFPLDYFTWTERGTFVDLIQGTSTLYHCCRVQNLESHLVKLVLNIWTFEHHDDQMKTIKLHICMMLCDGFLLINCHSRTHNNLWESFYVLFHLILFRFCFVLLDIIVIIFGCSVFGHVRCCVVFSFQIYFMILDLKGIFNGWKVCTNNFRQIWCCLPSFTALKSWKCEFSQIIWIKFGVIWT